MPVCDVNGGCIGSGGAYRGLLFVKRNREHKAALVVICGIIIAAARVSRAAAGTGCDAVGGRRLLRFDILLRL